MLGHYVGGHVPVRGAQAGRQLGVPAVECGHRWHRSVLAGGLSQAGNDGDGIGLWRGFCRRWRNFGLADQRAFYGRHPFDVDDLVRVCVGAVGAVDESWQRTNNDVG